MKIRREDLLHTALQILTALRVKNNDFIFIDALFRIILFIIETALFI